MGPFSGSMLNWFITRPCNGKHCEKLTKFPKEPSEYYKTSQVQFIALTHGSKTISHAPVLAYALLFVNGSKKYHMIPSVPLIELAAACDHVYLIDGL